MLATARGTEHLLPLEALKIKIPAAFSARRDLESLALLSLQAFQPASRAGIIAIAIIIMLTTMTLRISRLTRSAASRPEAARSSARWERRLDIRFLNLKS